MSDYDNPLGDMERAASLIDDAMDALGENHPEFGRLRDVYLQIQAVIARIDCPSSPPCSSCNGLGSVWDWGRSDRVACSDCDGHGRHHPERLR